MNQPETIKVSRSLVKKINQAIDAALAYEKATGRKRKLGITGEIGEVLVCYRLGLRLVIDPRSAGFDAIDKDGLRVEIKSRRSESEGLPKMAGRTSRFSEHKFDYALLVLLDSDYRIVEVWRAGYNALLPHIVKQKRRDPNLNSFKREGECIIPKQM